jgi:hypothetical protein
MKIQKLPKTKLLKIIEEELSGLIGETKEQEAGQAVPRGIVPTQKQSGVERATAAMLNDLLSRVEELERAEEDTRRLLGQIIKKMGAKL